MKVNNPIAGEKDCCIGFGEFMQWLTIISFLIYAGINAP
jgi:hypothetical protein